MIGLPAHTQVWLAAGHTDLRRGFDGLAGLVQAALTANPYSGHVFVFRGKRGDLLKVLWWDGQGLCLLAKRLDRGRFVWPQATAGSVSLTRPNFPCCWKASTGACRCAPGSRKWRDETDAE